LVLAKDGIIHSIPIRGIDSEWHPEILIDVNEVGGHGQFYRQSIKPFIGMSVDFIRCSKKLKALILL